jgi:amino-acid N-acetyltransferase
MDFLIRPARAADIPAIYELVAHYAKQKHLLARTCRQIAKLRHTFFVAVDKQTHAVIGCGALEIFSSKLAEVRSLAVNPACKNCGIGRALVAACLHRARSRKIAEVMTITSSDAFFQKQGFDFALPNEKKALFFLTGTHGEV